MNFNLIERNESDEFIQKFIKLYYDKSYNVDSICKILDMSTGKYQRIKNELADKGKIDRNFRSLPNVEEGKYYFLNKRYGTYTISRNFDGRQKYFMSVPTEEMAVFCVELFRKYKWDKKYVPLVRRKMLEEFNLL